MVIIRRMWSTLGYCLDESLRGHHHLFDGELVRRSFDEPLEVGPETVAGARELLERLRGEEGLAAQRRRIQCAPDPSQRLFVRIYFDYLDGFAKRTNPRHH
jgi:hypothetical protein